MITHSDDGPDFDPDDPLTVILRPTVDYLGPPPGRYEAIRRGATRRWLLRTAVGVGLSCAVAALVALPFRMAAPLEPASPTLPLAPPSGSPSATDGPSATSTPTVDSNPSATPTQLAVPGPEGHPSTEEHRTAPPGTPVPTRTATRSVEPSAIRSAVRNGPYPTAATGTRP